ncbi:MAG TPA: hypothetical protein VH572_06480 [Gaiella sp.]
MTAAAIAARLRPAVSIAGRAADSLDTHVKLALATIVGAQVALTAVLFFSVDHNGWLTYQGGDQIWLATTGWELGRGVLAYPLVGYGWPLVLAPLTWITGASSIQLLPLTTILQVGLLAPIATFAVYDIGTRLYGRVAGLWCAAAWVAAPFVALPLFVDRYQERWAEQVLVQGLGLTQLADFPSMVAVLVAAAFVVRSLEAGAFREAALAGTLAGFAAGMKPANYLFLVGPVAAYVLARRWREGAVFAVALVPATVALMIWKERGLGTVPLFAAGAVHVAAGSLPQLPLADSIFDKIPLDLDHWERNMSNLREFFWSARLVQWAPLAGAIVVARRSVPVAGLLLGWLLGYVVVKGSSEVASIENASFWRLVMPALPAYVLLAAAVPLLLPTAVRRLRRRLEPPVSRRPPRAVVVGAVVLLAAVPLAVVRLATLAQGPEAVVVNEILVPVDGDTISLRTERRGEAQLLTWTDTTTRARTFYHVYRTQTAGQPDTFCIPYPANQCQLAMIELGVTRERSYVDRSPEPGVTYRVGVAANWVDDTAEGDVFALSPPVQTAP